MLKKLTQMVKQHSAGQFVPGGVYLKSKAWELVTIAETGGQLPPGEGVTYYQVPVLMVLALGPVAGLAFILFVPVLVPLLALYATGKVIARHLPGAQRRQAHAVR